MSGVCSASGAMKLYKVESATIVASDGSISATGADRLSVAVSAAAAAKLDVTSVPGGNVTAGANFSVDVRSEDAYGNTSNVAVDTALTLNPSGTGSIANNTATITAGTSSATLSTVQYLKAESLTLVAHRTSGDSLSDSAASSAITLVRGAFAKLQLLLPNETAAPGTASGKTGSPTARTAGSSFTVTVNAVDANWNLVSSADTVGITSSDTNATLPANAALVAGTKNFSVTAKTAGGGTVTATDITDGSMSANTSPSTTINAGAFAKLQLLLPGETAAPGTASGKTGSPSGQTSGASFSVTVNGVDANWNPVSATDTVGITSSDGQATLPGDAALAAGTHTFAVTLRTTGSRTVTATDSTDGSMTANTSPGVAVSSTPTIPALVSPADTVRVNTATPTLTATFSDPDNTQTGKVTFQGCPDNACSSVLQTLDSTSTTLAFGANGSATYSGGTVLADGGTYYWRAKNVDSLSNASSYSSTRSFAIDLTPPTLSSAVVASDGTTVTVTWSENLDQAQSSLAGSAFSVTPNGGAAVSGTGASVTYPAANQSRFTLASAVHHLDSLALTYTKPGPGDLIRDLALATGNAAATGSLTNSSITNNTTNVAPSTPALVTPTDGQYVNTATPTLTATFGDPDTQDTGKVTFQVCSDNACSSVLQTLDSTSTTLAVGANGSATYSGGTPLADGGTYYWRAKNVDSSSNASSYSATHSVIVDPRDRKRVGEGKRGDVGGRPIIKKE